MATVSVNSCQRLRPKLVPFVSAMLVMCTWCKAATARLLIMSVFNLVRDYIDRLDARQFCFGIRIAGHDYCWHDRDAIRLSAAGAWARRWFHFGGHSAAWAYCCGNCANLSLVRMTKEQPYEFGLFSVLGRIYDVPSSGDLSQSQICPQISHCCLIAPSRAKGSTSRLLIKNSSQS